MEQGSDDIQALIAQVARLPGLGPRSARRVVLALIRRMELSVGELNEVLGLSQSAMSQHLAVLRRDELVATMKEAQTVYYSLRSHEVREMIGLLHRLYCSDPK